MFYFFPLEVNSVPCDLLIHLYVQNCVKNTYFPFSWRVYIVFFIMSVHYKFKSALEYDTVTFDGLHISVKDLKNAIIQQKRIGKNTDFDLQVTNAQTKEGK